MVLITFRQIKVKTLKIKSCIQQCLTELPLMSMQNSRLFLFEMSALWLNPCSNYRMYQSFRQRHTQHEHDQQTTPTTLTFLSTQTVLADSNFYHHVRSKTDLFVILPIFTIGGCSYIDNSRYRSARPFYEFSFT